MFRLSIPAFVGLIVSLFSLGFASTAWAASAFSVAAFDSLRTFRAEEKPTDGKPHIMIEAARGETESFQVAVSNHTNATLSDLTVVAEGLPGQVEIYASGSVLVDKPGRSTGAVPGRYFDLLRPVGWESIAPGEYMPYWVDVHVPEDTAPGLYEGRVTVMAGGQSASVSVSLRVWDFSLPKRPSLKLAFAFQPNWMQDYYGYSLSREQLEAAQDVMLEHRLGPVPMWGSTGDELYEPTRLRECIEKGMNVFLLPLKGSLLESRERLIREAGVISDAYAFGYDEILMHSPERIPAMRADYEAFRSRYRDILRINTSQPDERLIDFVDIFVVPVQFFTLEMARERETWWYSVGSDGLGNQPDFRIDFPSLVQRGFLLAAWKAGVSGQLYWAVQREWPANRDIKDKSRPENEWRTGYHNVNTGAWVQDNGGGNLFYPDGQGSMLPSARVKRMRDGIEDYEYLAQLNTAQALLRRKRPEGWERLEERIQDLLQVPDALIRIRPDFSERGWHVVGDPSKCSLTTHPSAVYEGRQALRILPQLTEISMYQDVPVSAGKSYEIEGWIKTDDLSGSARLRAEVFDEAGNLLHKAESGTVSGSSRRFIQCTISIPQMPPNSSTLRISLVGIAANDSQDPLQKAFFDNISVTEDGRPVTLDNPGFEEQRFWITDDPATYGGYRRAVAECLEECARLLGQDNPFTDYDLSVPEDEVEALALLSDISRALTQPSDKPRNWPREEFDRLVRYLHKNAPKGGPVSKRIRAMAEEAGSRELHALAELFEQMIGAHSSPLAEVVKADAWNQTFPVQPGLLALAARYSTTAGTEKGTIHLTLNLQDSRGTDLVTLSSRTARLIADNEEWSIVTLLADIPGVVLGERVRQAEVIVTVNDVQEGEVQIDLAAYHSKKALAAEDYEQVIDFVNLITPALRLPTVSGTLDAQVVLPLAEEKDISAVEIALNGETVFLHDRLPAAGELMIDTLELEDDTHEISVSLTVAEIGRLAKTVKFRTHNYWTLWDPFRPPSEAGWFGVMDYSLTLEESPGWEYSTGQEEAFWGDGEREVRTGNTEEYLIWETHLLRDFTVTVYAQRTDITEYVNLSVSSDGVSWTPLSYTVEDIGKSAPGWHKLVLKGDASGQEDVELFRLVLLKTETHEEIHIGEVEFKGLR